MVKENQSVIKRYKCVFREQLERRNQSVRGLFGDQTESTPDSPSYSTADNFIRKGTGNIDTAWLICQKMGITLNDAFIPEDSSFEEVFERNARKEHADAMLGEIIKLVIGKGKISTIVDIAEILVQIGQSLSAVGCKREAAEVLRIAADSVKDANS